LIVGGAQEALHARPGNYRLILKNRKGFVKLAIQTGTPIVPVISFGEIDVYDQPPNEPGSFLRAYQDFVKKWTGVVPAVFLGRGFLENTFGFLPYSRPITTVIGAPIEVIENSSPSREEVGEMHQKFIEEIGKLFEDHKHKYIKNADNVKIVLE
jgi:2-acylglycerol O-acyltransferase 2